MVDLLRPIAPLRPSVQVFPWRRGPFEQLLAFDTLGYAPDRIVELPTSFQRFDLLDGRRSLQDLERECVLNGHAGTSSELSGLRAALEVLDANAMLQNDRFERRREQVDREFAAATVRAAFHAGSSYPQSASKLQQFVAELLNQTAPAQPAGNVGTAVSAGKRTTAVIAPHIDLKIGASVYAPAYHALADCRPDLVVILATSHYGSDDWFMPLFKDMQTPLGQVHTARDIWEELDRRLSFDLCREERSHRIEHSIEFHLPFIQTLFKNSSAKTPRILPLLIGSFHEFVRSRSLPGDSARFLEFVNTLRAVLLAGGLNVAYIASVDFAHFGRKFGDNFDAHTQFEEVRQEDTALIDAIQRGDADRFFRLVSAVDDKRRICGLSPIYTMLKLLQPASATLLDYALWDERERASAVSYAALSLKT